ncbi:hypothetical protein IEQ34_021370 [Dendrobium chrysotoxum]|uniref:Transmembrane protein n=1 Tax=Dendrobium chrysotoxum TaxID=161865 RepID=A0AAV7G5N6_DENCH|nr:hypothetical protein IEQ34_021370 [Dendrobium chrysotoxum]
MDTPSERLPAEHPPLIKWTPFLDWSKESLIITNFTLIYFLLVFFLVWDLCLADRFIMVMPLLWILGCLLHIFSWRWTFLGHIPILFGMVLKILAIFKKWFWKFNLVFVLTIKPDVGSVPNVVVEFGVLALHELEMDISPIVVAGILALNDMKMDISLILIGDSIICVNNNANSFLLTPSDANSLENLDSDGDKMDKIALNFDSSCPHLISLLLVLMLCGFWVAPLWLEVILDGYLLKLFCSSRGPFLGLPYFLSICFQY